MSAVVLSVARWICVNMTTSLQKMKAPATSFTMKQILLSNQHWWRFYEKYGQNLRSAIITCIIKLLSCKTKIRGYHEYHCANPNCSHVKYVFHTCKCKLCSSCGKKATDLWITKQQDILPKTSWQHITFTMPSELWDFFWYNRYLLNLIPALAAHCIKTMANKKKVTPGIFIALHTFGRDLKRNVHIHLSTTNGGLADNSNQWKNIFFHQPTLMRLWRYQIIALFRQKSAKLIIPPAVKKQLHHAFTFNQFLDQLYRKTWIVHCSKPSNNPKLNIQYLGRYIKRPPIAESKLKHYDGNEVTFNYLDHTSQTYRQLKLSAEDFIKRLIQHIPDQHFRMIRYYGFLAHRVRGKLLPLVYQLLGQARNNQQTCAPTFSQLIQKNFHFDPLSCILCGSQLFLAATYIGKTTIGQLLPLHRQLALLKKI